MAWNELDFVSTQRKGEGSINSLLFRTITLAQNARCPMGIYLNILDQVQGNPIQSEISMRKESVSGAHSTRRATYVNLNPTMGQHGVYDRLVPEYSRKAFTRLRLSSHKLKMETGGAHASKLSTHQCIKSSHARLTVYHPTKFVFRTKC